MLTASETSEHRPADLDDDNRQKEPDRRGSHRFVLAMTVRMVFVCRLACDLNADERHDVRRAVRERVKAVRKDADRAARIPERDLRGRDGNVQEEDAGQNAGDGGIPLRQWAVGARR